MHIFSMYVHTDDITYFSQDKTLIVLICLETFSLLSRKDSLNLINIRQVVCSRYNYIFFFKLKCFFSKWPKKTIKSWLETFYDAFDYLMMFKKKSFFSACNQHACEATMKWHLFLKITFQFFFRHHLWSE